jgi:hypothetical protein
MNVQPHESERVLEYRFLKFETHDEAEREVNRLIADGWQFVSYSAAGWEMGIMHFVVVSRAKQAEGRRFGF